MENEIEVTVYFKNTSSIVVTDMPNDEIPRLPCAFSRSANIAQKLKRILSLRLHGFVQMKLTSPCVLPKR